MERIAKEIVDFILFFLIAYLIMRIIFPEIIGIDFTAVVSPSMEHRNKERIEKTYYEFLEKKYNYSLEYINTWPFKNGFAVGDVLFVIKTKNVNVGDVVLYKSCGEIPISHRIVYKENNYYSIKGDNNDYFLKFCVDEEKIEKDRIIGKVYFILPKIGYLRVLIYYTFGI
jgi:SOS-response transcriptional repressor LexA